MTAPPSYPPIKTQLPRDGEPAYIILAADPFPTPSPEEAGTTLTVSDTGDKYQWTSTKWIQTHTKCVLIAREYKTDVAEGLIPGESLFASVARNPGVTTTFADCWGGAGIMVYPTAAEAWELVSDDIADTSAGTGARTVLVTSLDSALLEQTQVVTMNGASAVALTGTHLRPESIVVLTAGTDGSNVGKITLKAVTGGNVRNVILPDIGRSHDGHFTIPSNKEGKVLTTLVLYPKNGSGLFKNRFKTSNVDAAWVTGSVLPMYQNIVPFDFKSRPSLPPGTDLQLQVNADSGVLDVTVLFELILREI